MESELNDIEAISRDLLERTLDDFRPGRWSRQIVNPEAARSAAEAATQLGFDDLVGPFMEFADGLTVRDTAFFKKYHPVIDEEYMARYVDPLTSDSFRQQYRACKTALARENLLLTMVMRGHLRAGLTMSWRLPRQRRLNVWFVAAIELFRQGKLKRAQLIVRLLPRSELDIWGKPHMALGITGRAAWPGYPYPDY